jgi:hypothetical protein
MFEASFFPALIGALVGTAVSALVQLSVRQWRIARARKALSVDLGLLLRHIDSSLKSLEISADAPAYMLAARLRYARFEELMLSGDRLELIEALQEQERARLLIASIRNSDILLDELATRIGNMEPADRPLALEDARLNLRILRETVAHLGLTALADLPDADTDLAADVRRKLSERELHAESNRQG